MAQAFGIVSFAGNNIRVGEMQNYRPVGAVSFLGRYRVIDFQISNMRNSEIEHIFFICRQVIIVYTPFCIFKIRIKNMKTSTL